VTDVHTEHDAVRRLYVSMRRVVISTEDLNLEHAALNDWVEGRTTSILQIVYQNYKKMGILTHAHFLLA